MVAKNTVLDLLAASARSWACFARVLARRVASATIDINVRVNRNTDMANQSAEVLMNGLGPNTGHRKITMRQDYDAASKPGVIPPHTAANITAG
jgi:hypothetical protein